MWSAIIPSTSWLLAWFLVVAAVWLWLHRADKKQIAGLWGRFGQSAWLIPVFITLFVRLLPTILLPVGATYDIESFKMVADALLAGKEVYQAAAGRHPYLPLQMYVLGGMLWAANVFSIPFVVMVKIPAVLADVGITAVIYHSFHRRGASLSASLFGALLYALNPISILVSAYHGQFDAIPVLLLLLAWYTWQFDKRLILSAVTLGLAILSKTWPLVFLPILIIRLRSFRQRLIYSSISVLIPIAFSIGYLWIFKGTFSGFNRAFTHTGVAGYWGYSALMAMGAKFNGRLETLYATLIDLRRWVILAAGIVTLWITRRQSPLNALTTIILTIFAVSAGMGIQWLLWIVPFAILIKDYQGLKWYSLFGALFLLIQLYGIHMYPWAFHLFGNEMGDLIIRAGSIPAWITVCLWAGLRLYRAGTNSEITGGPLA